MTETNQEEIIKKKKIIELLGKGYNRSQLIADFGFAERTVDSAVKQYRELAVSEPGETPKTSSQDGKGTDLTVAGGKDCAQVRKQTDAVLPEWLAPEIAGLFDGSVEQRRTFLAGMAVPIMGLRLFAELVRPLVELLSTWQQGQAEAARAAQGSGEEIARRAAFGVAQQLSPEIQALKSQIGMKSAPDPLSNMMSLMQGLPLMLQTGTQLMQSLGLKMPGQAVPQGPPQGSVQQPQAPPAWEPPPIETHSINELEEKRG